MLKRDFKMVQIEELGKVIAQMIGLRNGNAARKLPELAQTVYTALKLDLDYLLNTPIKDIHTYLDGEDKAGLQRMDIAAKLLIEEAYMHPDKQKEIFLKAKELLEYIGAHDNTFSLERVALLEEINQIIRMN